MWWRLKSPASRVFTQPFIQAQIKENIKVSLHWPLWWKFTMTGEFPVQRASNAENVSIWWLHHESRPCIPNNCAITLRFWRSWQSYCRGVCNGSKWQNACCGRQRCNEIWIKAKFWSDLLYSSNPTESAYAMYLQEIECMTWDRQSHSLNL